MHRRYTPRRQSERWLDADCPKGVLAIYDNGGKTFDRYTVFYVPTEPQDYAYGAIGYRGMSEHPSDPQGFGIYADMPPHAVAAYRYRVSKQACKWSSLPDDVKTAVRYDCKGN